MDDLLELDEQDSDYRHPQRGTLERRATDSLLKKFRHGYASLLSRRVLAASRPNPLPPRA
jgi:hypothetical protein